MTPEERIFVQRLTCSYPDGLLHCSVDSLCDACQRETDARSEERERCAKIAEEAVNHNYAWNDACRVIADRIREGAE